MRWLNKNKLLVGRVLDFGSGRGFDATHFNLEAYDPHWGPELPAGKFNTVTCIYVFNTLDFESALFALRKIRSLLKLGGIAYIAVRRDIKVPSKGRGCIQHNVKLNEMSIKKTSSFEIYELRSPI